VGLPSTENTAHQIICDALIESCQLRDGDDPSPEEEARCVRRLNQLINLQQTRGRRLWLLQDYAIPLVAGTGIYYLAAAVTPGQQYKPINVEDQYYLYSAANGSTRRPVFRISRSEWDMLSVTSQKGPITQIFIDPQQTQLVVNTWLIPDANEATGTLHVVIKNQVTNFVGITDQMNFPVEWAMYLLWALADQRSNGQPLAVQQKCAMQAAAALEVLDEWDAEQETSILLQPDQRMMLPSRFRK
jgi:hypothetical protein